MKLCPHPLPNVVILTGSFFTDLTNDVKHLCLHECVHLILNEHPLCARNDLNSWKHSGVQDNVISALFRSLNSSGGLDR
jgi:hypothetical protein